MKFLMKAESKKKLIKEHKRLVRVLRSKDHKDDLKEADLQEQELEEMQKSYAYTGPMTLADINLSTWNTFFKEGGQLNQPKWLETNRRKEIENQFVFLSRLHSKV